MKDLKRKAKTVIRRIERICHRLDAFTPEQLTAGLRDSGVEQDDVLLAHISMSGFSSFTGKPTDIIAALRSAVGPAGTLLMPSQPFSSSALAYVQSGETFDVRRTPSRMGIVTELFRRSPGTLRSLHPTHPVLASGPQAAELVKDHRHAHTPCGAPSAYAKLPAMRGKIVLLGTGINVLTFWHYLEEVFENSMPNSPFTAKIYEISFKGYSGEVLSIKTRFFDPDMSKRRNLKTLEHALKRAGYWHIVRVGTLEIIMLKAADIEVTVRALCQGGVYCYE